MELQGLLLSLAVLTWASTGVDGHGYLYDPPSRSSLWRHNVPDAPKNYDDNALSCGGRQNEWATGEKRCGVCGDPYILPQPRPNEAGGKYGRGIIYRTYQKGQVVDVKVMITANHKGYFEFRLCPNNDVNKIVTQECLDSHLLLLADGSRTRWTEPEGEIGEVTVRVRLPVDLVCSQCVLQWKWHTGNSWGVDPNGGSGCVGCGPIQEEFYNCADIAIVPSGPATALPVPQSSASSPGFPINPWWPLPTNPTLVPLSTQRLVYPTVYPSQPPTSGPITGTPWWYRLTSGPLGNPSTTSSNSPNANTFWWEKPTTPPSTPPTTRQPWWELPTNVLPTTPPTTRQPWWDLPTNVPDIHQGNLATLLNPNGSPTPFQFTTPVPWWLQYTTTTKPTTSKCFAINNLAGIAKYDEWCQQACLANHCMVTYCSC